MKRRQNRSTPRAMSGFTLVELLVVITIIVILLALLTPALDRAIYQAELASCAANLRGVGTGSIAYAVGNGRWYFHREGVYDDAIGYYQPRYLTMPYNAQTQQNKPEGYDDRPIMRGAFPIKSLNCPLTDSIDLDGATAESTVVSGYPIWAGWRYNLKADNTGFEPSTSGMLKLGRRIIYNNKSYDTIAGDAVLGSWLQIFSSHPDDKASLTLRTFEPTNAPPLVNGDDSQKYTVSEYYGPITGSTPGLFDLNFVRDDGSVTRIDGTIWGNGEAFGHDYEPRMDILPVAKDANNGGGQFSVPTGRG